MEILSGSDPLTVSFKVEKKRITRVNLRFFSLPSVVKKREIDLVLILATKKTKCLKTIINIIIIIIIKIKFLKWKQKFEKKKKEIIRNRRMVGNGEKEGRRRERGEEEGVKKKKIRKVENIDSLISGWNRPFHKLLKELVYFICTCH